MDLDSQTVELNHYHIDDSSVRRTRRQVSVTPSVSSASSDASDPEDADASRPTPIHGDNTRSIQDWWYQSHPPLCERTPVVPSNSEYRAEESMGGKGVDGDVLEPDIDSASKQVSLQVCGLHRSDGLGVKDRYAFPEAMALSASSELSG